MTQKDKIPVIFPSEVLGAPESGEINADILGSFTGRPQMEEALPVQDADDL